MKQWVDDSPRQLKPVIEKIKARWNITVSLDTLKRVLKSFDMSWRRMRRVTAHSPSADYERKRSALDRLKSLAATGAINLYHLDETGFTLVPPIPYAWQVIGQTLEIPSQRSKRLNVLGLMSPQGQLESYVSEQSITGDVVVACIEAFFPRWINQP